MNISFTKLGCEECEFCDRFLVQHDSSISQFDFDEHQCSYRAARMVYQEDVTSYVDCQHTICVSVDLQKVFLLPHLPMYKSAIFTPRLIVFNETFLPVVPRTRLCMHLA